MAARNETLRIQLAVDGDGQVRASLSGVHKSFSDLGAKAIALNQGLELVSKGFSLVRSAGETVIGFAAEAVSKWIEQEQAINKFNAALRSTGQFSAGFADDARRIAESLEMTSRFEEEAILGAERLLVSFGATQGQLPGLTRAVADLAAGLGVDLEAAALKVGKALEGQSSALGRYGITIDKTLPRQQQLAELQRQVNQRFGGQAQADVAGFGGQLELLNKAWDNYLKAVGAAIAASPELQALIQVMIESLRGLESAVKGGAGAIVTDLVGEAVSAAVHGFGVFVTAAATAVKALELLDAVMLDIPLAAERLAAGESLTPMGDAIDALAQKTAAFEVRFETAAARIREDAAASAAAIASGAGTQVQANEAVGFSLDELAAKFEAENAAAAKAAQAMGQQAETIRVLAGTYESGGETFELYQTRVVQGAQQMATAIAGIGSSATTAATETEAALSSIDAAIAADAAKGREIIAQRKAERAAAQAEEDKAAAAPPPPAAPAQINVGITNVGVAPAGVSIGGAPMGSAQLRAMAADAIQEAVKAAADPAALAGLQVSLDNFLSSFSDSIRFVGDTATVQALRVVESLDQATRLALQGVAVDFTELFRGLIGGIGPITVAVKATGSPTLPFSEYFERHVPETVSRAIVNVSARPLTVPVDHGGRSGAGGGAPASSLAELVGEVRAQRREAAGHAERTIAATGALARAVGGSRFFGSIVSGAERVVRRRSGNRAFQIGG